LTALGSEALGERVPLLYSKVERLAGQTIPAAGICEEDLGPDGFTDRADEGVFSDFERFHTPESVHPTDPRIPLS
jgi:hypothetical protein